MLRLVNGLIFMPRQHSYFWSLDHKVCSWSGDFCNQSCSWLDSMGNTVLCSAHGNPRGFFMKRKIVGGDSSG